MLNFVLSYLKLYLTELPKLGVQLSSLASEEREIPLGHHPAYLLTGYRMEWTALGSAYHLLLKLEGVTTTSQA